MFKGSLNPACPLLLKTLQPPPGSAQKPVTENRQEPATERRKAIFCRSCGHPVTYPDQQISIDGAFQHTLFNPQGTVFEVGCFRTASGCIAIGKPTDEFTWFSGFRWCICLCGKCHAHLGWQYRSGQGSFFFGLILDKLHMA